MSAKASPLEFESFFENLGSRLSEESASVLGEELRLLKEQKPPVLGSSIKPIHYIPRSLSECQDTLRRVLERLSWTQRVSYLESLLRRSAQQKVTALKRENARLNEKVVELEKELARSRGQLQSLLGLKPRGPASEEESALSEESSSPKPKKRKKRGAPKGHRGATRPVPEESDQVEEIPPPASCPHCQSAKIVAQDSYVQKFIEDIPPLLKTVLEQRYQEGCCASCGQKVLDSAATTGPPVKIGPNLTATLCLLRQKMGVSYRKLSDFATEMCQVPLSPSGVRGLIERACEKIDPLYQGIESALPNQAVLHVDETGWKVDGKRWMLWFFGNRQLRYFHPDPSRGSQVPKTLLGADFQGLLHSDFYSAYLGFAYTQKCLIHYLRDVRNELAVSPEEPVLKELKGLLQKVIKKAKVLQKRKNKERAKAQLRKQFAAIAQLQSENPVAQTLIQRIDKYGDSLINFIDALEAEPHNNLAERALRPAVIFRKISFGNRSAHGARAFAALASVLETARLKNKNTMEFLKSALSAPNESLPKLTAELLDSS